MTSAHGATAPAVESAGSAAAPLLGGPEFLADPYPGYARLRATAPVHALMPGVWLLTRYRDADRVLRDPALGKDFLSGVTRRYGPEAAAEPLFQVLNRFLLVMNPPEHTRLRALIGKVFGVRQAAELRRLAEREAEALVAGFASHGRADLVAAFAYPLPIRVICALLDLPPATAAGFEVETRAVARAFELNPIDRAEIDAGNRAVRTFEAYFRELCRERRRNPGPDLVSLLLRAEEGDQRLTEDEIIANLTLLFVAGHETTANMIGNALLALFRHPVQLALLRARPELLPRAVDEALRYDSAVQIAARVATRDLTVGGITIRAGEMIYVGLGAANRDPEVYPEPEVFRIERPDTAPNPLSFGGGPHYCLGARLARIELETALATLARRLPELRLPELDRPRWKPSLTVRGLESLAAEWSPGPGASGTGAESFRPV